MPLATAPNVMGLNPTWDNILCNPELVVLSLVDFLFFDRSSKRLIKLKYFPYKYYKRILFNNPLQQS